MPRKRKKSTLQRKPSLIFTESPVHIQNNVPSPVFCARHPPTALSVPIDDLDDLLWVSPQFRRIPSSGGPHGRRVARRRRKSEGATLGTLNKENTTHGHSIHADRNMRNKFKSLKFIGDPSTILSMNEDVNISFDTDTASDDENGRDNIPRISDPETSCDIRETKERENRRLPRKKFGGSLESIQFAPESNYDQETNLLGANQSVNVEDGVCDDNGNKRSAINKLADDSINRSPLLDESSVINFTHLKVKPLSRDAPVKRLFGTQLDSHKDDISDSDTCTCSESEVEAVPNTESESEAGAAPSVRRSARIRMFHKLLDLSDTPNNKQKQPMILVADTPEAEYGWPLKKYQLRAYLHNR